MKAFRNMLGSIFILIIVTGLGYIGWYISKEVAWPASIASTRTESQASTGIHSQHTPAEQQQAEQAQQVTEPNEPAPSTASAQKEDINPVKELHKKVSDASRSIQQVADLLIAYPYPTLPNVPAYTQSSSNILETQHFHKGLYALSEAIYLLNQQSNSLEQQALLTEGTSLNYQVYFNRYNVLLQNKAELGNVLRKMNEAKSLILSGFSESHLQYGAGDMQQANKTIYQMAQAFMDTEASNKWLENEVQVSAANVQQAYAALTKDSDMQVPTHSNEISIGAFKLPSLATMLTYLFAGLLVIGVIGTVRTLLLARTRKMENDQTDYFYQEG